MSSHATPATCTPPTHLYTPPTHTYTHTPPHPPTHHLTHPPPHLLQEEDASLRAKAAVTARALASRELGAKDLVQHGTVARLAALLQDEAEAVRSAAFQCLLQACAWPCTCNGLIADASTLPLLVGLAKGPAGKESSMALHMLNLCARVGRCRSAAGSVLWCL